MGSRATSLPCPGEGARQRACVEASFRVAEGAQRVELGDRRLETMTENWKHGDHVGAFGLTRMTCPMTFHFMFHCDSLLF